MASREKILRIEVTHVPAGSCKNAHIRITGVSAEGPFTLRVLNKLRHDKVAVKIEVAQRIFSRLVGQEIEVQERNYPGRSGDKIDIRRLVLPSSLPGWARGNWREVTDRE